MAFVNEKEKKRTIDHERNVYLTHRQTLHHNDCLPLAIFDFFWNENKIVFHANRDIKKSGKDGVDIVWNVTGVFSLTEIAEKKELTRLIEEALGTYGLSYEMKESYSVRTKIDKKCSWQIVKEI